MMFLIRGHRGAGKSSLLKRLQNYFPEMISYDLDSFVEEKEGKSIADIISQRGEKFFRDLEQKYLSEIYQSFNPKSPQVIVVALGGGYQGDLPKDVVQIMLSRGSDSEGRIFSNRPRLKAGVSALEESKDLFAARDAKYRKLSDFIFHMEEGFSFPHEEEKQLFQSLLYPNKYDQSKAPKNTSGFYCLQKNDINDFFSSETRKYIFSNLPIDRFELRSDIVSQPDKIESIINYFGPSRVLISLRDNQNIESFQKLKLAYPDLLLDWDIDLAQERLNVAPDIVSYHPTKFKTSDLGKFVSWEAEYPGAIIKLASPIESIQDLMEVLAWQKEFPKKRSFFPISKKGEFAWLRLYLQNQQSFQFIKNCKYPEISDQVSFISFAYANNKTIDSAVLGYPIEHSCSPAIHFCSEIFKNRFMIKIAVEKHMFEEYMYLLQSLDIKYLALTSPLKVKAKAFASHKTESVLLYSSANTLSVGEDGSFCDNTDAQGLIHSLDHFGISRDCPVFLWGGGGTLKVLKNCFSKHRSFSARTGALRESEKSLSDFKPQGLIWAISNFDIERGCKIPEAIEGLEFVFDLSYKDSSLARDYAFRHGLKYFNGFRFLEEQGKLQQEFWKRHGIK